MSDPPLVMYLLIPKLCSSCNMHILRECGWGIALPPISLLYVNINVSFNIYSILKSLSVYFCQGLFNQTFATGFWTRGTQIRSLSKYKKKKKERESYQESLGAQNKLNLLQMLASIGPVQFEAINYFPNLHSNHPTSTENPMLIESVGWKSLDNRS